VHIRDAVRGVILGLEAERSKVCGEIFNLGTDEGNYSKDDIVRLILKRMPETIVEYKDLTFGGDMRDIAVSFAKIKQVLGFETTLDVDDGIRELLFALKSGIIRNPNDEKYRNAQFIVQ
jgi:nucleoside-diphosphate-sugar epimerase